MPYYVVGRDWPDRFYPTNAKWPEPNQWSYLPEDRTKGFHASIEEVKRAVDLEKQEAARRESRKLKKHLFAAIVRRHTSYGATPLGLASAVGDEAIVAFLLDEGCSVTEGDRVGATPLMAAAARGHTHICQQLLNSKQGGNHGRAYLLRQRTRVAGEVAVHAAAKGGHLDTLRALLEAATAAGATAAGATAADGGPDAGATAAGATAAGATAAGATDAGATAAGATAADGGPDAGVGALDREGRDCFMMAAANDRPNVMSYLLQNHGVSAARADSLGRTALMHAAAAGAVQAVQLLLSLQPSLELTQTDHQGYGPLHHACLGGSLEVVEALSQRGVALAARDPASLVLLRLSCRSGHGALVDWMLGVASWGLLELVADGGDNPVFAAVRGGSIPVLDVLLKYGARIECRDHRRLRVWPGCDFLQRTMPSTRKCTGNSMKRRCGAMKRKLQRE
ncbi:hypothetical protein VOLCADRAFT_97209 [Volvox carteri f. nagariensis]|uniref:Uncharacterized protein n=1 Tax=Volvox carteri f. nagariensis TaxID=3068 RepID=D8UC56_VOLCA|nr:uncharacterized protein VOLCADRAFT_97209 [Volvox carteri f. nagariensis]EFJ42784.1 hypothetical protein VOLCADRAFT_97209 [Volvox carteri f. nagariensis]|eukprot:XP_002956245.1 hypothetical protein VOLCADRAFT_97209 [Volvox carteri f. nagariensis]